MFKNIKLNDVLIIEDFLTKNDLHHTYNMFMNNPNWSLSQIYQKETAKFSYPWINVMANKNIHNIFLYAYTVGVMQHLNYLLNKQFNYVFNIDTINRITINAQKKGDPSYIHEDGENTDTTCVIFTTPEWEKDFGGELQIKDKNITYKPGTCVIFNSSMPHDAKPIKMKTNLYRTSLAITLKAGI